MFGMDSCITFVATKGYPNLINVVGTLLMKVNGVVFAEEFVMHWYKYANQLVSDDERHSKW